MARGNDCLNEWVVERLFARNGPQVERIVEIGPGPGVGLEHLLAAFPTARVGHRPVHRDAQAGSTPQFGGRLTLTCGDTAAVPTLAPVDLIVAVHVLYFWPNPQAELRRLRHAIGGGGTLCMGYQLFRSMPTSAQVTFPLAGHHLYTADDDVTALLREAGFEHVEVSARGPHRLQLGRP